MRNPQCTSKSMRLRSLSNCTSRTSPRRRKPQRASEQRFQSHAQPALTIARFSASRWPQLSCQVPHETAKGRQDPFRVNRPAPIAKYLAPKLSLG